MLIRVHFLRFRRRYPTHLQAIQGAGSRRQGVGGKRHGELWVTAILTLLSTCWVILLHLMLTLNVHLSFAWEVRARSLTDPPILSPRSGPVQHVEVPIEPADGVRTSDVEQKVWTGLLSLFLLGGVLSFLVRKDVGLADGDLDWLLSLPMSGQRIFLYRFLSRSLPTEFDLALVVLPCLVMAAFYDHGATLPLRWLLLTVAAQCLLASIQVPVETVFGLRVSPIWRRRVQAVLRPMAFVAVLLSSVWLVNHLVDNKHTQVDLVRRWPDWILWTPTGLLVRVATGVEARTCVWAAMQILSQVLLFVALGAILTEQLLRRGPSATGGRGATFPPPRFDPLSRLLSPFQDIQMRAGFGGGASATRIFLSMLLAGASVIASWPYRHYLSLDYMDKFLNMPGRTGALVFGIAALMVIQVSTQTLVRHGPALQMLYTVPCSLSSLLTAAWKFWAGLALLVALEIMLISHYLWLDITRGSLAVSAVICLACVITSQLAVYSGVCGSDPMADDLRQRGNNRSQLMVIAVLYNVVFSLAAGDWWLTFVTLVLAAAMVVGFRQRALDQEPYLLDPVARPTERVSFMDGLIACQIFIFAQVPASVVAFDAFGASTGTVVLISQLAGGLMAYTSIYLAYRRSGNADMPRVMGAPLGAALRTGFGGAVVAAAIGATYANVSIWFGFAPQFATEDLTWLARVTLTGAAVIGAPLFEEFIFRGLLFRGLRRSHGFWPSALASALIFTAFHPPGSALPVFCGGIIMALACEQTGALLAPMVVHALYNLTMISCQLWT